MDVNSASASIIKPMVEGLTTPLPRNGKKKIFIKRHGDCENYKDFKYVIPKRE